MGGGGGGFGGRNKFLTRQASVDVKPDWNLIEQMNFADLQKLAVKNIPADPQELKRCGFVGTYDRANDSLTVKTEKPLGRFEDRPAHVTTTDDPIIRELASEGAATVFATDTILCTLMTAPRSIYSWDIIIQKVGNVIFFDKRDDSDIDMFTVNESAPESWQEHDGGSSKDSINSPSSLAEEAAYINQNFIQQVVNKDAKLRVTFEEQNPFDTAGTTSAGYIYRRWKLTDTVSLIARCDIDAALPRESPQQPLQFTTIRAIHQYDSALTKLDWRQKIDTQRGNILAGELRTNAPKFMRWTAQALLAGSEQLKLGYVARANRTTRLDHTVLGVQTLRPGDFAKQINLSVHNMWAILNHIVNACLKLKDGKYVLLKDPQKTILRLYEVPEDTFDQGVDEEISEEVDAAILQSEDNLEGDIPLGEDDLDAEEFI